MNEKCTIIIATIGGMLGYMLGGLDKFLEVFIIILVLDTIAGMVKGLVLGCYSSKKFRNGIFKKSGYMLAVILAVQLDKVTGNVGALRSALLLCFIANESASIIENLGEMGVPLPPQITDTIEVLRKKSGKVPKKRKTSKTEVNDK